MMKSPKLLLSKFSKRTQPSLFTQLTVLLAAVFVHVTAVAQVLPTAAQTAVPTTSPTPAPAPQQLPTVSVTAPRAPVGQLPSFVGGISDAPIEVTPQSIGTLSAQELKATGTYSLSGAFRNETSASDAYNTIGYIESIAIRGFLLDNILNFRRDGMPISNYSPLAIENKERIDILKGVSGVQAGVSAPGGLVNYVIKRPTNNPLREVTLRASERGTLGAAIDLGGRTDDKSLGYRINAAIEDRKPIAKNAPGKGQFVSGFFDYRLANFGTLEFEFEHYRSKQISVPGLGLFDSNGDGVAETIPQVVNPRTNLNSQPWSQPFESVSTVGSIRYEHNFGDKWRAGVRIGLQNIATNDRLAFPDGCSSAANYVYPGLCANGDVDIYDYRSDNERRRLATQDAYIKGDFKTGSVKHEVNVSIRNTLYTERFEAKQAYNFVGTINLFAPSVLSPDPNKGDKNTLIDAKTKELAIADAITFNDQWSLWSGLRFTQLDRKSVRTDGSRLTQYKQNFTTPWLALSYRPWAGGMVYGSWGQGVESEVVPNRPSLFANAGEVLTAIKSKQIELGFKQVVKAADGGVGLFTAALFSIEKPSSDDTIVAAPLVPTRVANARIATHTGLELSYSGAVVKDWSASVNLSALNARQTRDLNHLYDGKRTTNVAPFSLSANVAWAFTQGWEWRNGVSYFSSKPVTRDNTVVLAGAAQVNTLLTFNQKTQSSPIVWRFGIDNVFDKRYWREAPTQYWGGTYLFAAQPRTFRFNVTL